MKLLIYTITLSLSVLASCFNEKEIVNFEKTVQNSIRLQVYGAFCWQPGYEIIVFENGDFIYCGEDWVANFGPIMIHLQKNEVDEIFQEVAMIQETKQKLLEKDTLAFHISDPPSELFININNSYSRIIEKDSLFSKLYRLINKSTNIENKYIWGDTGANRFSIHHKYSITSGQNEKNANRNPFEIDDVLSDGLFSKDCIRSLFNKGISVSMAILPNGKVADISLQEDKDLNLSQKSCLLQYIQILDFNKIPKNEGNLDITFQLEDFR